MTMILRIAAVLVMAGCARNEGGAFNQGAVRDATDTPVEFQLPASIAAAGPRTMSVCISPLIDARTGAELRLVRTRAGWGDYDVPAGRYGARAQELLRIDCARRRAIGLVLR